MKRTFCLTASIAVLLFSVQTFAQSTELKRIEIAAEFSTLNRGDFGDTRTEPGLGARFTYNLTDNIALESSGYFFPHRCFNCSNNGQIAEVVGGLKAGKRFRTWGLFGKVRPGLVSFSQGQFRIIQSGTGSFPFQFESKRLTSFATDIGAVLEFYPSKRIVTRFDAGDTIIHFNRRAVNSIGFDPVTNTYFLVPFTLPSRTTHNFQFSASIGFRF